MKLQTCAASSCGSNYYVTTSCTSSTPAPVPTLAPITMAPSNNLATASGYLYSLAYDNGGSCSTLYGGTLTKLNTCMPYTSNLNQYSGNNAIDAIGVGYVYQIVTVKCDPDCTSPTTLYTMTVYYSDSTCTKTIPNPNSYKGRYYYNSISSPSQCQGSSKYGVGTQAALSSSIYPTSAVFDK
jgi:hypothetical protein